MKIGLLKNRKENGQRGGEITYTHLIIEDVDDVFLYQEILSEKNANVNTSVLFGFNSQNFRNTLNNYLVHEVDNIPAETRLLAFQLENKETDTSLVDFCIMSDKIVYDKCVNILKHINQGKTIRINNAGGYSFVSEEEINDYDELFEAEKNEIFSVIHFGELKHEKYNITKKVVIIENDLSLDSGFREKLDNVLGHSDYDVLLNFKNTIRTYTDGEVVRLFTGAVKKGLNSICFQTTGQDLYQIRKMVRLLDKVVELTGVEFKIYIDTDNLEVFKFFNGYEAIKIK